MIVMNIELDNLMDFDGFRMNFSYPKKIVNSSIPNEFLITKPNFRYKKINILMGANASGKTSVGKALMKIFNFIEDGSSSIVKDPVRDKTKDARFLVDFLIGEEKIYRVDCYAIAGKDKKEKSLETRDGIELKTYSAKILKKILTKLV